jgi:potassium efflux system protein
MSRVLLALLMLVVFPAWGELTPPEVTLEQVDAAEQNISATLPEDDPARETLLKLYGETRAALQDYSKYSESLAEFQGARDNARGQANSLQDEVARLQATPPEIDIAAIEALVLSEAEQQIKLDKSELEALKSRLADIRAAINAMPGRTKTVRELLTQLWAIHAELESQLALMSPEQSAGGEGEARLWRALAEQASHGAEKASLDEELLSEPMRMELLKAQLDKVSLDIKLVESRLQALESRAGELRQDEVAQARAEATLVQEGTRGKHELVQALADENAGLTEDFTGRSALIEQVRQREAERRGEAEQIEGR